MLVAAAALHAQGNIASLGINFSALVRDSSGSPQPSKPVQIRFTILTGQTGTAGNAPWVEIQKTVTDAFGFVNATIGTGAQAGGTATSFAQVDFSQGNYWLLAEVFDTKALTYQPLAKQALQAVAYAKTAGAAGTQAVPPGTICAFAGDFAHIPTGWVECQGQQLDNRVAANMPLFNVIGYTWGGEGNVFRLPGTNDLFLRGATNGKPGDPDAASRQPNGNLPATSAGSFQQTALQYHLHGINYGFDTASGLFPPPLSVGGFAPQSNTAYGQNPLTFGYAVSNLPGSQTPRPNSNDSHPVNVLVNYIIKL
jgi:microcystin-dependent protein